jgi:hypothetical protein
LSPPFLGLDRSRHLSAEQLIPHELFIIKKITDHHRSKKIMTKLLIILSPPRSFSSVVSTMIGQHPDLYGFPELRLFVGDRVEEVIEFSQQKDPEQTGGPPGLLRTLAQIHDGVQTNETVLKAIAWLQERRGWPTHDLFEYLLTKISPKIGVEKTPRTAMKIQFINRAYECFPDAYYLHLTRHPVSTRNSMLLNLEEKQTQQLDKSTLTAMDASVDNSQASRKKKKRNKNRLEPIYTWDTIHRDIISLTSQLPDRQTLRIKGEDLLSEPDRVLHTIAEWLEVRTDPQAIEAMKHPEHSPYACMGPDLARGGNNLEFLQNPHLRSGKIQEPSLEEFWEQQKQAFFAEFGFDLVEDQEANEQVTEMAHIMGYA